MDMDKEIRLDNEELEQILDDYLSAVKIPSPQALAEWIKQYPQYEQELAEFTVNWTLTEQLPPHPGAREIDDTLLNLKGLSIVQNLLHEKRRQKEASPVQEKPMTGLVSEAKGRGLSIEDLARLSKTSIVLIAKLERKLIEAVTIPAAFTGMLAEALERTASSLEECFKGNARLPIAADYRANQAPTLAEQESFFDAIRNDPLLEEDNRNFWLKYE